MLAGEVREGVPWNKEDPWGLSPAERARYGPAIAPDDLWRLLGNLTHAQDQLSRSLSLIGKTLRDLEKAHGSVGQWGAQAFVLDAIGKRLAFEEKWQQFEHGVLTEYFRRMIDPESGGFDGEFDEEVGADPTAEGGGSVLHPDGAADGSGAAGDSPGQGDRPAPAGGEAP
jgi:hypothetical protein